MQEYLKAHPNIEWVWFDYGAPSPELEERPEPELEQ